MIKKIKYLMMLSLAILLMLSTKSQARITTNDPTVSSGGKVTITISSQEKVAYGAIDVTSNGGLTFVGASGGQVNGTLVAFAGTTNKTRGIATYTFKAPTVTETKKYKVIFKSKDMGNADGEDVASSSATATVTVKAKTSSNSGNSSSNETTTKPTFTSKRQTVYATSKVNVRSSYSTSSSILGSLQKGDSVKRTGLATKSVNGILWSKVIYNGKTGYISSSYLTTTKPSDKANNDNQDDKKDDEKKDNNKATSTNLKSLTVTPTGLSPAFAIGTTEYTMTVGSNIDEIEVNAVAEDKNASVKVTGDTNLKIGKNKITITVTAGKETKIYNITVTKEDKKQLQLSELLVEGLPLQPEFDSNIYEYTLTLDKSNVTELNITATPSKDSAEVEIVGNTDLQVGENIVTVLVKSADGENIATYQITVKIPEIPLAVQENNGNQDLYLYIGIGVGALLILIIIIAIIKKCRNKDDDNMYYGMYNPNENDEEDIKDQVKEFTNTQEIVDNNFEDLPKLDNEDLPKSLRKDKVTVTTREADSKIENQWKSDRSKKIDEFYNIEDDVKVRRRGKHSK